jgi:pyrroline-5-carboxylate reductase
VDLSLKTILFIGCGNMGSALVMGLRKLAVGRVLLSDIDGAKVQALAAKSGATAVARLSEGIARADIIILAIKPQHLNAFLAENSGWFKKEQVLISILAGIRSAQFTGHVPCPVIRAMPNTPALVGKGLTAISAQDDMLLKLGETLFSCVGQVVRVGEESMDAVTALSGSGPAYVFYFIESFLKAARAAGFDGETSKTLVFQTVTGALKLLMDSNETPESLRKKVTSPGGVTEAAVAEMKQLGFEDILTNAVRSGIARSKALGS